MFIHVVRVSYLQFSPSLNFGTSIVHGSILEGKIGIEILDFLLVYKLNYIH